MALTAVNCMSRLLPLAGLRREVGADEYRVPRIEVEHRKMPRSLATGKDDPLALGCLPIR